MDMFHDGSLPMGFAMALSQNVSASENYTKLTEAEKEELLNRAKDSNSDDEVDKIISELNEQDGIS